MTFGLIFLSLLQTAARINKLMLIQAIVRQIVYSLSGAEIRLGRGVGACNELVRIGTDRVCSDIGIHCPVCIVARARAPMSRRYLDRNARSGCWRELLLARVSTNSSYQRLDGLPFHLIN